MLVRPLQPPETGAVSAEEISLIQEVLRGDARAFDQIIQLHHRRVFHFLHQMTRQRQDAEDLTQQTFIKAYHHLGRFDPYRPMINWLLTIARRTALNHFRDRGKWEQLPGELVASGPSPATSAEDRDRWDNVWDRMRAVLSQRQFEILWLRFGEGLSTAETARVVGLTQTHVKILIFRARKILGKREPSS
jgi:RNA polymerase sigma-70 factor (ECF subfamily)